MTIYLGAEEPQPVLGWSKDAPGFNVHPLKGSRHVRRRLAMPYLYEIGAHTGCGCGFLVEDETDAPETAESLAALRNYVKRAVGSGGRAELLVCWLGDEGKPAAQLSIAVEELDHLDFTDVWDQPLRISVHL